MSNFEFRGYTQVVGEKHIGVAEVKAYGKIVLRYKIVMKKDGQGYFPVPASTKVVKDGTDLYLSAFTLDSNSDKEECEQLIMANVRRILQPQQAVPQQFTQQTFNQMPPMQQGMYQQPNLGPQYGTQQPQRAPNQGQDGTVPF